MPTRIIKTCQRWMSKVNKVVRKPMNISKTNTHTHNGTNWTQEL